MTQETLPRQTKLIKTDSTVAFFSREIVIRTKDAAPPSLKVKSPKTDIDFQKRPPKKKKPFEYSKTNFTDFSGFEIEGKRSLVTHNITALQHCSTKLPYSTVIQHCSTTLLYNIVYSTVLHNIFTALLFRTVLQHCSTEPF